MKEPGIYVILCEVPQSLRSKPVEPLGVSFGVTAVARGSEEVCLGRQADVWFKQEEKWLGIDTPELAL